jgi:phosphomannomutase
MRAIRFGTDGWRGLIAEDLTYANVRRVAAALAISLEGRGVAQKGVAVGYDRRFLSPQFAAEAAAVLADRGVPVRLAPAPLPTPVLSWAVTRGGHAAGLMVTASHNPPEWNGIKIKEAYGGPSTADTNAELEAILAGEASEGEAIARGDLAALRKRGLVTPLDVWDDYVAGLKRLIDFDAVGKAGFAVYDAMHGTGAGWTDQLLRSSGLKVRALRTAYNPGFGGVSPEPTPDRLGKLHSEVVRLRARLGLANDGDADRIAAVDENGRFFSPQRILAVFAKYLSEVKGHKGDVAKTVSATSMLDLMAEKYGYKIIDTPIGFRHAGALMAQRPILIGGEESGAVGIGAHLPERDGVANALLLAEIVGRTGLGLRAYAQTIFDEIGYFTYARTDLRPNAEEMKLARARLAALTPPASLCGHRIVSVSTLDGLKFNLDDHSWLLVRASGTEPILRVYAEARSDTEVKALLAEGKRLAGLT